jgi:hypothetical protein
MTVEVTVGANVTNVTTGQTAVALTSAGGPFTSPNGATFAYRSAALTSNPAQADGAVSFTVNAKDNSNTSSTNTNNGTVTFDSTAPALSTLQMFDIDHNGKVDHVVATFNETLAACTAPCTTGWTLTSAPGGATLSSVTISGTQATLNLTEGTVNTAVGSFTVTLATTSGVIDNVSNHSSFAATAPADKAAPVATAVTLANGNGTVASNDTVAITYSEPLSFGSLCTTWAGAIISGNGNVDVTITNAGANDVLSLSSVGSCTGGTFRLGSIALGADYVNSDRTYTGNGSNQSQITWTAGSNTLTILLGGGSSGATGVAAAVPTYTPNAAITDNASPANAIATFSGAYASTRF